LKRTGALLLATLSLTGCLPGRPQGRDLNFSEASRYFAAHRPDLEALVALVEACRPIEGGDTTVWRDGSGAKRCAKGDPYNLERVRAWLKAKDFVAAGYYTTNRDPLGPLAGIEVVVHTSGLGASGTMTKLSYAADEKPIALGVDRREDGSVIGETRGLGPQPFRWFWEHSQ